MKKEFLDDYKSICRKYKMHIKGYVYCERCGSALNEEDIDMDIEKVSNLKDIDKHIKELNS